MLGEILLDQPGRRQLTEDRAPLHRLAVGTNPECRQAVVVELDDVVGLLAD
jgi:hypothetical protein